MVTTISETILKKGTLINTATQTKLTGIGGADIATLGTAQGRFKIENYQLPHLFHVLQKDNTDYGADGLLGYDFLIDYCATLSFFKAELQLTLPPWHEAYEPGEQEEIEESGKSPRDTPHKNNEEAPDGFITSNNMTSTETIGSRTNENKENIVLPKVELNKKPQKDKNCINYDLLMYSQME